MATKRFRAGFIIHVAAVSAATIGAGLAQVPTSDNLVITPIQLAMIGGIAKVQGRRLDDAAALSLLTSLSAGLVGRAVSQVAVGWIPAWGNTVNATTAFSITEAIGWGAYKFFEEDKDDRPAN